MPSFRRICVFSMVALLMGQVSQSIADEHEFVRLVVRSENGFSLTTGVLVEENTRALKLLDLETLNTVEVDKKSIHRRYDNISESTFARQVGFEAVFSWKVANTVPNRTIKGKVAAVDGGVIFLSLGERDGVVVGDELFIMRGSGEIRDPDTGEILGSRSRKVAKIEITEVREKLSKARLSGDLEVKLEVGDQAVPINSGTSIAVLPLTNSKGEYVASGVKTANKIIDYLTKHDVEVVERALLPKVLNETLIQQTGAFDAKTIQRVGELTGAFAVATGDIQKQGTTWELSVRLIEVRTGKVLTSLTSTIKEVDDRVAMIKIPEKKTEDGKEETFEVDSAATNPLAKVDSLQNLILRGGWVINDGTLMNSQRESLIALPTQLNGNYKFQLSFTRLDGDESLNIGLPLADRKVMLYFSNQSGLNHGLGFINGTHSGAENPTVVKPGVLQNDKEYQLEVDVSSDEKKVDIKVSLDQKQIIHFVGVPSQVSLKQGRADSTKWVSPIKGQMSIGITQATYQFKDLRVLEK